MFLIFIDDLAPLLRSPSYIFADDVKFVGKVGTNDLLRDIETAVKWSDLWDLPLNLAKSHILSSISGSLHVHTSVAQLEFSRVPKTRDLGIVMTSDYKCAEQCGAAAHRARKELFRLKSVLSCRRPEVFVPLYRAIVRPHLEYCVQAWSPHYQKDVQLLEKVQRLATRMVEGQKGKDYNSRLKDLGLFSLARRRLRGDLIEAFKIMKGLSGLKRESFFELAPTLGTRGHSMKLKKNRSRLLVRSTFFTRRVIDMWNKLPPDLVSRGTVASFKQGLDSRWQGLFPDVYP